MVCTLIDNDMRHHSGQNFCPQQILSTGMMRIVVDKSADHAKQHFDLILPQYQCQRKCLFLVHEMKKALRDTLMQAMLSELLLTTEN